ELTIARIERTEGAPLGYFFIFRDASEQRRREAERSRFERLVAMGTMVAGFAHEVRNPVAAMRSIAEELSEELVAAGILLPPVKRMLHVLERIERIVKTSLQFGRPAAPRRAMHRPWALIAQAFSQVSPRRRRAGDEFRLDIEEGLPDVFCDEG